MLFYGFKESHGSVLVWAAKLPKKCLTLKIIAYIFLYKICQLATTTYYYNLLTLC